MAKKKRGSSVRCDSQQQPSLGEEDHYTMAVFPPFMASLLASGEFSDLKVQSQGKTFPVHKAIVCAQSQPFAAMAKSNFEEGITGTIKLDEDEPENVERLLSFLYTGDYSDKPNSETIKPEKVGETSSEGNDKTTTNQLIINTQLYVMAELWDILGLKDLAVCKYREALKTEGETPSFTASLQLMCENLREDDHNLKDIAFEYARVHSTKLVKKPEFKDACNSGEGIVNIAYELLQVLVAHKTSELPLCPWCRNNNCVTGRRDLYSRNNRWHCHRCDQSF